jgi:Protein of unknown function (DUF1552)
MRNIKFSRRSLLRGLGYGGVFCSGLARNVYAQTLPRVTRVAMFGYANGSQYDSSPTGTGTTFVLQPHMAPLEAVRNDILVFRNLTMQRGLGNAHKAASFSIFGLGAPTSIDQLIAASFNGTTPLASLEVTVGETAGDGGIIPGLSQLNGTFLPGVRSPVAAYQRVAELITGGAPPPSSTGPTMSTPTSAEIALLRRKSVLDFVMNDIQTFQSRLGPEENAKVQFYLESLRTLERDVGSTIPGSPGVPAIPISVACSAPPATTLTANTMLNDMPVHNRVYLDIIAMAFACNITRVASAMWGGGENHESFQYGNVNISAWHTTSHGDPDGAPGQQMINMQAYLAGEFAYFITKLKSYSDGANTLLDNTAAVLSTQNGSSVLGTTQNFAATDHPRQNSPFVVAGSCGGAWQTGRLIDCAGRNHNDVYLSIAQAVGMKVTSVGLPAWCMGPMITPA